MKRIAFSIVFVLLTTVSFSQKYAYVDTEYILSNIPAYKAAQDKLNEISLEWQKEIELEYKIVEKMYKDFQTENIENSKWLADRVVNIPSSVRI